MEFSRQEYWTGLPLPVPRNIPDPEIELASLTSPAWTGAFLTTKASWEVRCAGCGRKAVNALKVHHRCCEAMKWGDPMQRNTAGRKAGVFEEMSAWE